MRKSRTCAQANMRSCDRGFLDLCVRWSVRATVLLVLTCAQVHMGTCAFAQLTGKLRLNCEPLGSCMYVVDGKHRMNDREITLMEGAHRFNFWAPERSILDTQIYVVPGITTQVDVQLHYSPEYISYRRKADNFRRNDVWMRYAPPVLAAGVGAWAVTSIVRYADASKRIDDLADEYVASGDPGAISDLKDRRMPDANSELRNAHTQMLVSSGLFVASAGAVLYLRHRLATRQAPVFEDKERVRFDGLVWVPGRSDGGTWAMGLTIPIQ